MQKEQALCAYLPGQTDNEFDNKKCGPYRRVPATAKNQGPSLREPSLIFCLRLIPYGMRPLKVLLSGVTPSARLPPYFVRIFLSFVMPVGRATAAQAIKTRREKAAPAAYSAGASDGTERVEVQISCSMRKTDGFSRERFILFIIRLAGPTGSILAGIGGLGGLGCRG